MKEKINHLKKELINNAFCTTDPLALQREHAIGNDIANIRNKDKIHNDDLHHCKFHDNNILQSFYVTDSFTIEQNNEQTLKQILLSFSQMFNISIEENAHNVYTVPQTRRKAEPWNEFEKGDECLVAAFPTVFLFGTAYYKKKGTLTTKQRHHLLLQYTANAAKNSELIFYLFDQLQRHETLSRVTAKVESNKLAFQTFIKFTQSTTFKEKLKLAVKDVKSQEAKDIMSKLMPIMSICAPIKSQFGLSVSKQTDVKIRSMCHCYGPASVFLTIAPDNVNNPMGF